MKKTILFTLLLIGAVLSAYAAFGLHATGAIVAEPVPTLLVFPSSDENPINTLHTITATATADGETPFPDQILLFVIFEGPNTGFAAVETTGPTGIAEFSWISSIAGTDVGGVAYCPNEGSRPGFNFEPFPEFFCPSGQPPIVADVLKGWNAEQPGEVGVSFDVTCGDSGFGNTIFVNIFEIGCTDTYNIDIFPADTSPTSYAGVTAGTYPFSSADSNDYTLTVTALANNCNPEQIILNIPMSEICPRPVCGNGVREGTEACDGADFGGATCIDFGAAGGELTCTPDCQITTENCIFGCFNDEDCPPGEICTGAGSPTPDRTECNTQEETGCFGDISSKEVQECFINFCLNSEPMPGEQPGQPGGFCFDDTNGGNDITGAAVAGIPANGMNCFFAGSPGEPGQCVPQPCRQGTSCFSNADCANPENDPNKGQCEGFLPGSDGEIICAENRDACFALRGEPLNEPCELLSSPTGAAVGGIVPVPEGPTLCLLPGTPPTAGTCNNCPCDSDADCNGDVCQGGGEGMFPECLFTVENCDATPEGTCERIFGPFGLDAVFQTCTDPVVSPGVSILTCAHEGMNNENCFEAGGEFVPGDTGQGNCQNAFCGDGEVNLPGEQCDDGNNEDGDGCNADCGIEFCGDGILQTGIGEQCDDGNNEPNDGCNADCGIEFCGDGILQTGIGEQCDEGGEGFVLLDYELGGQGQVCNPDCQFQTAFCVTEAESKINLVGKGAPFKRAPVQGVLFMTLAKSTIRGADIQNLLDHELHWSLLAGAEPISVTGPDGKTLTFSLTADPEGWVTTNLIKAFGAFVFDFPVANTITGAQSNTDCKPRVNDQKIGVLNADNTIDVTGTQGKQMKGSLLTITYPDEVVWDWTAQSYLYPFIFHSDSAWTVDVCTQVPQGYNIQGVYDETGAFVSTDTCEQTFVSGEDKVIAFDVVKTGSPPVWALQARLRGKGPNGRTQSINVQVPTRVLDTPAAVKARGVPFTGAAITGSAVSGMAGSSVLVFAGILAIAMLVVITMLLGRRQE